MTLISRDQTRDKDERKREREHRHPHTHTFEYWDGFPYGKGQCKQFSFAFTHQTGQIKDYNPDWMMRIIYNHKQSIIVTTALFMTPTFDSSMRSQVSPCPRVLSHLGSCQKRLPCNYEHSRRFELGRENVLEARSRTSAVFAVEERERERESRRRRRRSVVNPTRCCKSEITARAEVEGDRDVST